MRSPRRRPRDRRCPPAHPAAMPRGLRRPGAIGDHRLALVLQVIRRAAHACATPSILPAAASFAGRRPRRPLAHILSRAFGLVPELARFFRARSVRCSPRGAASAPVWVALGLGRALVSLVPAPARIRRIYGDQRMCSPPMSAVCHERGGRSGEAEQRQPGRTTTITPMM